MNRNYKQNTNEDRLEYNTIPFPTVSNTFNFCLLSIGVLHLSRSSAKVSLQCLTKKREQLSIERKLYNRQ